jgi:hypothetical protein
MKIGMFVECGRYIKTSMAIEAWIAERVLRLLSTSPGA